MRPIKFRAWDSKLKNMIYDSEGVAPFIADDNFRKVTNIGVLVWSPPDMSHYGGGEWAEWSNGMEIMQYTGLKDKAGKEIYEGDVVQIVEGGFDNVNDIDYFEQWLINEKVISHTVDEDGYISYQYAKYIDTVVLDRFPCYWLKNESFGYEGEDLVSPSDCEVIGNVYQHAHLLPKK